MLHRAFARQQIPVPAPLDAAVALDIALRLDLAGRIGTRTSSSTLQAEIGPACGEIAFAVEANAALSLRSELALRQVAGVASSRRTPLVVLKGGALSMLGVAERGARSFGDLDVLVPADRVRELRFDLLEAGWSNASLDGAEFHGPPLAHPAFGILELHRYIPGVRRAGSSRFFDAHALLAAGLTDPIDGFDSSVRAPARVILGAHAIVHALHQHADPSSYPLFRFIADVQDIGAGPDALAETGRYLRDLDSGDLAAIAQLASALESGTARDLPAGPSRDLIGHLVAGALDEVYVARLRARGPLLPTVSALPRWLVALRKVYKSTFVSRAYIDRAHGPQKHWTGYAARRLLRPFHLALRLAERLGERGRR